jgi:hypothetical protein
MGIKTQIVDDITTARAWAELVEKGGCTAKVLDQASEMIGRLHNAERLLDSLIAEDRASRSHFFTGSLDRPCEICGEPDRDPNHYVTREHLRASIEAEREACLTIAKNIKETHKSLKRDQGEHAAFLIENLIRARS